MTSSGDWNDIIDNAEAQYFVGREHELTLFRQEISRTPLGLHLYDFSRPGGASQLGLTLVKIAETAETAGFDRISTVDHVWQSHYLGGPEHEVPSCYPLEVIGVASSPPSPTSEGARGGSLLTLANSFIKGESPCC